MNHLESLDFNLKFLSTLDDSTLTTFHFNHFIEIISTLTISTEITQPADFSRSTHGVHMEHTKLGIHLNFSFEISDSESFGL